MVHRGAGRNRDSCQPHLWVGLLPHVSTLLWVQGREADSCFERHTRPPFPRCPTLELVCTQEFISPLRSSLHAPAPPSPSWIQSSHNYLFVHHRFAGHALCVELGGSPVEASPGLLSPAGCHLPRKLALLSHLSLSCEDQSLLPAFDLPSTGQFGPGHSLAPALAYEVLLLAVGPAPCWPLHRRTLIQLPNPPALPFQGHTLPPSLRRA